MNLEDILKRKFDDPTERKKENPKGKLISFYSNLSFGFDDELEQEKSLERKAKKLGINKIFNGSKEILSEYITKESKIYNNYNFEKNIIKEKLFEEKYISKINYNLNKIIGKNFNSIQTSPLGFNLGLKDDASITADNLGEFALPIVEYIHQTQPDYVIASDRGARLLGLAVFRLYRELYGRFPTADGTLRFKRFSKSNSQSETEEHLRPLVNEMLANRKNPRVLVLDDWVASGGTKRIVYDIFDRLGKGKIKTKFGVLIGGGADISGHGQQTSGFAGVTDWRDDSNIIGIQYGKDRFGYSGIRGKPVRSREAVDYRRRMYKGILKLAQDVTKKDKG